MSTGNIKIAMNRLRKGVNTVQSFNTRSPPSDISGNENIVQETGGGTPKRPMNGRYSW
jgi:hypothetical protein